MVLQERQEAIIEDLIFLAINFEITYIGKKKTNEKTKATILALANDILLSTRFTSIIVIV